MPYSDVGLASIEDAINEPIEGEAEALELLNDIFEEAGLVFDEEAVGRATAMLRLGESAESPEAAAVAVAKAMGVASDDEVVEKGDGSMVTCRVCLALGQDSDGYCRRCGSALRSASAYGDSGITPTNICYKCGALTQAGDTFCGACGSELAEARPLGKAAVAKAAGGLIAKAAKRSDAPLEALADRRVLVRVLKMAGEEPLAPGVARGLMSMILEAGHSVDVISKALEQAPQFYLAHEREVSLGIPDAYLAEKSAAEAAQQEAIVKSAHPRAWKQAEELADQLVEKSDGRMTKEQAIIKVAEDYPELYGRYLEETRPPRR